MSGKISKKLVQQFVWYRVFLYFCTHQNLKIMKYTLLLVATFAVLTGCRRANPEIVSAELVPINVGDVVADSAMQQLIAPYKTAQAVEMNVVVGESDQLMRAELPEGLLNAFVSDAMLAFGNALKPTDMAITNFGGLRNDLPQGAVTVGHVLQIMPFDNALVFVELKGTDVRRLADAVAAKGGEVETGMALTIRNGKAENVLVGGQPIDDERIYRIITTDYLSYGNDHLEPLADHIHIEVIGTMLRDALINHIRRETEAGHIIHTNLKHQIHVEK